MDSQALEVGYVQQTLLHYIENTGDSDLMVKAAQAAKCASGRQGVS